MNWRDILDTEIDALTDTLEELGGEYRASLDEVKAKAASDADRLALLVGEPGFSEAAKAAAANLALFAALEAVEAGDSLDKAACDAWITGMTTALRVVAGVVAAL